LPHKKAEGKSILLKYVYETYPPRWKEAPLLPDELRADDAESNEWKPLFKNAVIHYHPDKVNVETDGKRWKVLCERSLKSFHILTK
jgi:hypothetical protein